MAIAGNSRGVAGDRWGGVGYMYALHLRGVIPMRGVATMPYKLAPPPQDKSTYHVHTHTQTHAYTDYRNTPQARDVARFSGTLTRQPGTRPPTFGVPAPGKSKGVPGGMGQGQRPGQSPRSGPACESAVWGAGWRECAYTKAAGKADGVLRGQKFGAQFGAHLNQNSPQLAATDAMPQMRADPHG
jgi:hypothetical protein